MGGKDYVNFSKDQIDRPTDNLEDVYSRFLFIFPQIKESLLIISSVWSLIFEDWGGRWLN